MKTKNSVEKLFELAEIDKTKRESVAREIDELKRKEEALSAEALAAARSGNTELYLEKTREKDKLTAEIFVKGSFLDSLAPAVTQESAVSAWNAYAADYNPRLKKAVEEFAKEKEKLCGMYNDLLEMQDAALQLREQLGRIIKINSDVGSVFRMDYIPCRAGFSAKGLLTLGNVPTLRDPDAVYNIALWSIRNDRPVFDVRSGNLDAYVQKVVSVLASHKSSINKQ